MDTDVTCFVARVRGRGQRIKRVLRSLQNEQAPDPEHGKPGA